MANLLGCPTEILHMILSNIHDRRSLYSLCLAGNQLLLSIAQPLIWREVEWRWDASLFKEADDEYQRQVREFCSNEQRTNSVRSLDITVYGTLTEHYTLFSDILPQELPKLANVTHARISFSEADIKEVWATTGELVSYIVYNLPSLISLCLEGCDRIQEDFEGKCSLPNLRSLSLWYCDSDYVAFARDSPTVEVLEILGGKNPKARDDIAARPYYSFWAGRLAREVEEDEEYNSDDDENETTKYEPLHTVRRIAFHSKEVEEALQYQWDAGELTRYFTEEPIISHPDLEELVIDAPMDLGQYNAIISNLDSPALRVLFLNLGTSISIADFQSKISLEKFESLSELWIPSNGLDPTHIFEKFALEDSPSLERLYFNEPRSNSNVDYKELTRQYADKFLALQSIGWNNVTVCHISRSDDGTILDITEAEWTKPLWLEFNGIGQWWEVDGFPEVEEQDEENYEEGEEEEGEEEEGEGDEGDEEEDAEEEGEEEEGEEE